MAQEELGHNAETLPKGFITITFVKQFNNTTTGVVKLDNNDPHRKCSSVVTTKEAIISNATRNHKEKKVSQLIEDQFFKAVLVDLTLHDSQLGMGL